MWCPSCRADVAAELSTDNRRMLCARCQTELGIGRRGDAADARRRDPWKPSVMLANCWLAGPRKICSMVPHLRWVPVHLRSRMAQRNCPRQNPNVDSILPRACRCRPIVRLPGSGRSQNKRPSPANSIEPHLDERRFARKARLENRNRVLQGSQKHSDSRESADDRATASRTTVPGRTPKLRTVTISSITMNFITRLDVERAGRRWQASYAPMPASGF